MALFTVVDTMMSQSPYV